MITSKLRFAAAGALAAGLAIVGLGLVPRGAPGSPLAAVAAEHSPATDVNDADSELAPEGVQPQPAVGSDFQPNALNFGSVRVGATVEGSVRIFRVTDKASGLALKIEPPAFVRVDDVKVGSQEFGANSRGFCDLSLSLDTERTGELVG